MPLKGPKPKPHGPHSKVLSLAGIDTSSSKNHKISAEAQKIRKAAAKTQAESGKKKGNGTASINTPHTPKPQSNNSQNHQNHQKPPKKNKSDGNQKK